MTKVFFANNPSIVPANTGIGRVVHAQHAYLPALGIEITGDHTEADVIAAHANAGDLPRVDVLHIHGLYWTGDSGSGQYSAWHHTINGRIAADCRRARVITVPSPWVAGPFLRDMRIRPEVIGHGLDLDEWGPGESQGYLLWNKNRGGDVCDPTPPAELARLGVPVVATFAPAGPAPSNLRVTGQLAHAEMKKLIQGAGIYLATTKETFGIGTLEALACGVPVLGYRHGGTTDLVEHERTGYLVQPGDVEGLLDGYAWLMARRRELSANCREVAQDYSWHAVMERYAALYRRVAEERTSEPTGVSVVITNYNYGEYLHEAIESVLAQTVPASEILVVDDGSTDASRDLLAAYGARYPGRIRVLLQSNRGVAEARNTGIAAAVQPFITCLDADDRLDPRFIETLLPALQNHRGLGIAYSGLALLRDGALSPNEGWPPPFSWDVQSTPTVPAGNCVPSACMFRRDAWQRVGGYQQVWAPGEDGELWTRLLSIGYEARQVTREPLMQYRLHEGSASRTKVYKRIDTWHPWMRDRQYPFAAPATKSPLVRSYSEPLISVVIERDDEQGYAVFATLDSLLGQTFRNWEAIADDWGILGKTHPYPFLRYNEAPSAPLVLRIQQGQYLAPDALETMLRAYVETGELGDLEMGCKSCASKASPQQLAQRQLAERSLPANTETSPSAPGKVRMEFIGPQSGAVTFFSEDRKRQYRGGRQSARFADVDEQDVVWLTRAEQWRVVRRPEPTPVEPPAEIEPTVEGAEPYQSPPEQDVIQDFALMRVMAEAEHYQEGEHIPLGQYGQVVEPIKARRRNNPDSVK